MTSHDPAPPVACAVPKPLQFSTHSPRSSVDSPRTPNSPFLHNLSNRFRKGSNASNLSSPSEPPSQPADPADKLETAQSAKRFLLSVVRNDWEWPLPEQTASGGTNDTAEEKAQNDILSQRGPVTFRTRHEAPSDLDLDLEPLSASRRRSKRNSDPYRFENPEAIGDMIYQKKLKRRRLTVAEAKWNEGLQLWMERRDAWTAAESQLPKRRPSFGDERSHRSSGSHVRHKSSLSSDETKISQSTQDSIPAINGQEESGPNWPLPTAVDKLESGEIPTDDNIVEGPYLPIYPPLFPSSHTLRSRIKPAAYPTIYSKVVLQSLTPNVPIPLTHMIGALVDGWKAEGNWPPQTLAEQQQQALLKRAKGSKKGESAFHKWRKERDADRARQQEAFGTEFGEDLVGGMDDDESNDKKGFRKSISGAVKKVFGIHSEEEEDGGLARLGLEFLDANVDPDGLMNESIQTAENNVTLNRALLDAGKA